MEDEAKKLQADRVLAALSYYACDANLVSRSKPIVMGKVICATTGKIAIRYDIPPELASEDLWTDVAQADSERLVKTHTSICNIIKEAKPVFRIASDQIKKLYHDAMKQRDEWEKLPPPKYDYNVSECPCCGARLRIDGTDLIDISDEEEKTPLDDKVFEVYLTGDGVYLAVYFWADYFCDFLRLIVGVHFSATDANLETMSFYLGRIEGTPVLIAEGNDFTAVCVAYNHDLTGGNDDQKFEIELKAERMA